MGFQDRRYKEPGDYGEGGGFTRAFARMFGEGDNFLSWSVPFFRFAGIAVRVHIFYIIFIVAQLIWPLNRGAAGLLYTAMLFGSMFLFVLLHEFGHCFACRRVGGEADEIVMWPLGGLAMCHPPRDWKANFITTLCGPLVNLVIAGVLAGVLLGLGVQWTSIFFNPFKPWMPEVFDPWLSYDAALWKSLLFAGYQANVFLFLFNVLLPMYPMDGGRMLQAGLWRAYGYKKGTRLAVNIGFVLAILIGGFAAITGANLLFSVAFFCGFTCYIEKRNLAFVDDDPEWELGRGLAGGGYQRATKDSVAPTDKAYAAALKKQQKERETQAEVDRILDKIREQGMGTLTRKEKAILKDATERQRGVGGG